MLFIGQHQDLTIVIEIPTCAHRTMDGGRNLSMQAEDNLSNRGDYFLSFCVASAKVVFTVFKISLSRNDDPATQDNPKTLL